MCKFPASPKFTLHFATINTLFPNWHIGTRGIFTLHFATINTMANEMVIDMKFKFTLHFATINTLLELHPFSPLLHLHYTLLLLIRRKHNFTHKQSGIYITLCYY